MRKLRVAVIGLGVGERHIGCYEAHPDCEVTTLCDRDEVKLGQVGERHPGKVLRHEADEVLNDPEIDVVSIATCDDCHFEQARLGIENGKHLLVEKPLCLNEQQARDLRSLLRQHPQVRLSSNHVLRLSSRFQELRQQIHDGTFGNIYYAESDYQYGRLHKIVSGWRSEMEHYSVVLGGGVHVIDLLLWLLDDEAEEVVAYGNKIATANTAFRYQDMVAALIRMKSGIIAKVGANFGCPRPHFHALEVYGTERAFINRPGAAEVYHSTEKDALPDLVDTPYRDYKKPDLIGSFVDWILGRGVPIVTADDVFRAMATCFAMEKAVESSSPVAVEAI